MDYRNELKGCVCRINNCAIELFSMEEDLEIEDKNSWDMVGRDLRLKATSLYIDLSRVISSCESEEHKKTLTGLANKFFYFMDELGNAVKDRSAPLVQVCYSDTTHVLRKVVAALGPVHLSVIHAEKAVRSGSFAFLGSKKLPKNLYKEGQHEGNKAFRMAYVMYISLTGFGVEAN